MRIDAHFCLVSDQPVPNLTPLLDRRLAPRRAILLVTDAMRPRADWLVEVLRPRGIKTEIQPVADAWDFDLIQTHIMELIERESGRATMALNATGGTKLMSIAAYEAFRAYDLPIYYVHPERDTVVWLQPRRLAAQDLEDRLKLEDFLLAHGTQVDCEPHRSVPCSDDLELASELVRNIEVFQKALGTVNWLAGQAENPRVSAPLPQTLAPGAERLLDLFAEYGHLRREGNALIFKNESSRFFVNGGWLELHVFDEVRQMRREDAHIQDVAYGVQAIRHQREGVVRNELDVIFLRNNRLHVIECKTRKFGERGEEGPGAEALYKLDALRDLMGGLKARAMLVSWGDLPDHDKRRAGDLGIDVCDGLQLRELRSRLAIHMGR